MKIFSVIVIACFLLVLLYSCSTKTDGVKVVSPVEMQTLLQMDNVQFLDVRTPREYNEGYIATAQNIDFLSATFNQDIKKLDKQKPVLLYCQKGGRSAKCAKRMKALGFEKIVDMKGGFSEWKHQGLPIAK